MNITSFPIRARKLSEIQVTSGDFGPSNKFLVLSPSGSGFVAETLNITGFTNYLNYLQVVTSGSLNDTLTEYYPLDNPSGFTTTGAIIDLTNLLSGYFEGELDSQEIIINDLVNATGSYAGLNFLSGVSGVLDTRISSTGSYLLSQLSSYVNSGSTGIYTTLFYSAGNPSGFITTASLSGLATSGYVQNVSGALDLRLINSGNSLSNQIGILTNQTGGYFLTVNTGLLTGLFYPLSSNPAGYLTGIDLSSYLLRSETGLFYPRTNPSGYITGVDLSSYIQTGQTGSFYPVNNPSGFITNSALAGYVQTSETGILTGQFYPLNSNPSNYLTSLNGTGVLTGVFVSKTETGILSTVAYVNLVSGNLQLSIGALNAWSGSTTGLYYPLNDNPAGYLTNLNGTGALTGEFVRRIETGVFANTGYVVGISGILQSEINTLNTWSGTTTSLFYPLSANPANYANTSYVDSTSGALSTRLGTTGTTLQNQLDSLNNQTGNYYPRNNPSGYITNADSAISSASGALRTDITTINNWTGFSTGLYYPLNSNPSGYLNNLNGTGILTGVFVSKTDTGSFATTGYVFYVSGILRNDLTTISNWTGTTTGLYYSISNPQNFITQTNVDSASGALSVRLINTGATLQAQIDSINTQTGSYYPRTNPSGYLSNLNGTGVLTGVFALKSETGNFNRQHSIGLSIDGGTGLITTGYKGYIFSPYAGTITNWFLTADVSGSCVIDIWKASNAEPTLANTITAAAKPTLTNQKLAQSSSVNTWSRSVNVGDTFAFNIESLSNIKKLTLTLLFTE